jgi:hypothetical protein
MFAASCVITTMEGVPALQMTTGMGQAPESVSVNVDEGAPRALGVTPVWSEAYYPNGESCDGADGGCRTGEATLELG